MSTNSRLIGLATVGSAAIVTATALLHAQESHGSDLITAFRRANDVVIAQEGKTAAIVNGRPIPLSKLEAPAAFAGVLPGPDGVALDDRRAYLEMLIDIELLVEEAERRGLAPGDEDVIANVKALQAYVASQRTSGSLTPAEIAIFDGWAAIGHPIEKLHEDPMFIESQRRSRAVANLMRAVGGENATSENPAYLKLLEELRAKAKIEILVDVR